MDEPHFPLLHQAIEFAMRKHRGQDRDGRAPLPYIVHPMEVVWNVRTIGGIVDEAVLCAAALHDVCEECNVSRSTIEKKFGHRVAQLVKELTRTEPSQAEIEGLSADAVWQLRSLLMLHDIQETQSPDAQRVKLADRLSNLQDSARTRPAKEHQRYLQQTIEILAIIDRKVSPPLWDAINEIVVKSNS